MHCRAASPPTCYAVKVLSICSAGVRRMPTSPNPCILYHQWWKILVRKESRIERLPRVHLPNDWPGKNTIKSPIGVERLLTKMLIPKHRLNVGFLPTEHRHQPTRGLRRRNASFQEGTCFLG